MRVGQDGSQLSLSGPMVIAQGLTKQYGIFPRLRRRPEQTPGNASDRPVRRAALWNCSLEVTSGEVFGLLGPNGAGKTTLIRLLLGYLRATSGSASIGGFDCRRQSLQVRRLTSYLPGEARLFRALRGRDVLRFFADVRGDADQLSLQIAERLDLDVHQRVAFMSTGMRQKLALAVTLASNTPVVILDEPTANLDPTARAMVLTLVQEAQQAGRTILFSSHVLAEVEEVCDRVVILRDGEVVHQQAMAELRRQHRLQARMLGELPPIPSELQPWVTLQRDQADRVILWADGELGPLFHWLARVPLSEIQIEPVGLRPVYDRFHGRSARQNSTTADPRT
jgi:ABC-2 type transport system ATP-binding protein